MSLGAGVWLVVVLMVVAANLPFLNQRVMLIGPAKGNKSFLLRLFELLVCYFVVGAVALAVESALGQIYPQRWEFFATTLTLFLTLAFPGFVYRYLLKR